MATKTYHGSCQRLGRSRAARYHLRCFGLRRARRRQDAARWPAEAPQGRLELRRGGQRSIARMLRAALRAHGVARPVRSGPTQRELRSQAFAGWRRSPPHKRPIQPRFAFAAANVTGGDAMATKTYHGSCQRLGRSRAARYHLRCFGLRRARRRQDAARWPAEAPQGRLEPRRGGQRSIARMLRAALRAHGVARPVRSGPTQRELRSQAFAGWREVAAA